VSRDRDDERACLMNWIPKPLRSTDAPDASPSLAGSRRSLILTLLFVAGVVALGILQCRAWNGAPNADGISYLELAAQYARGEPRTVANGYWSPLYPALLGAALGLTHTSSIYYGAELAPELRVALAVNLCALALATACFARLLLVLHAGEASPAPRAVRICRVAAGAALWVWCAIRLIGAPAITPDILLAGWLFLATADLVDASTRPLSKWRTARFSTVLALGYWTKAVFFPLVFVGMLSYIRLAPRNARRARLPWLVLPALALCAPLVVVQSVSQGHWTFGDTGRLNYEWYVNGVPHLQARAASAEETRQRDLSTTRVVQMAATQGAVLLTGSLPGSFPYWYDPTRFAPTGAVRFSVASQWRALRENAHWYRVVGGAFALLCLGAAAAASTRQRLRGERVVAMLPALTLSILYALTHPEGRLAGAALATVLLLTLYPGGAARRPSPTRIAPIFQTLECAALALLVVLALGRSSNRVSLMRETPARTPAREFARLGLKPGARVGVLGSPFGHYWAHEAGVRIVVASVAALEAAGPTAHELSAIAAESCARGSQLAAIVWRGAPSSGIQGVTRLPDGWSLWPAPRSCW
jgi:hypothetical protein